MEEKQTIEALAGTYISLRSRIELKEEEHKAELAPLKDAFDEISNELLEICNTQNLDSVRTPAGTVSRRVQSRYWASDWESMYKFILEHDAPFLLERRLHNGNMRQFLEENPGEQPAGLNLDRKYVIQVRRPTT